MDFNKIKSVFDERKDLLNLSFQMIPHHIGFNFVNPNLYELSKTLTSSIPWVKHQIVIEKNNTSINEDDKLSNKFTSIEYLREVMKSADDNKPKKFDISPTSKNLSFLISSFVFE